MNHLRKLFGISLLQIACWPAVHAVPLCTIVAEAASSKIVKQAGNCDQRMTPASTFKIALSLMGYDSGYLTSEHLPRLPFHEGYPDRIDSWRATTDPTSWIKNSVVWYSQQITEWLGDTRQDRNRHSREGRQFTVQKTFDRLDCWMGSKRRPNIHICPLHSRDPGNQCAS